MKNIACYIFLAFLLTDCRNTVNTIRHEYHYQTPDYNSISLLIQPDTLRFALQEDVYNEIKSFNCFTNNAVQYIAFFDRRSASINIYYLHNQKLYKQISVKNIFNNHQLHKTSVFIKNWDSIFIINKYHIYLCDSSGHKRGRIEFPPKPKYAVGMFDSNKLPVFHSNELFVIVRPNVNEKKLSALREWQILYSVDFTPKKENIRLHYPLPRIYQTQLYGYHFLDYNFCYNNRGKFVFSFPADTLLYETDLKDYHHSYFARSKDQQAPIPPLTQEEVGQNESLKTYALRDSYGSVFFDPYRKYYLRLARHKLSAETYPAQKRKEETVLILDEKFLIIGESDWPAGTDFDSIFFTPDGQLYARTNLKDEQALHFVRFEYQEYKDKPAFLTTVHHPEQIIPEK